ncbi:MAG TPA: hypothetical protein VKE88_04020 [Candidatus Nanoarchaeia archaeon]|nr:hypothetical protein [Candidatus Nanoarchaeia archaeon]
MSKRADLSLSINAIVVLILAITMLGLGLAFIRNTFVKTEQQFIDVADGVKAQIVESIQNSDEKIALNQFEIEMKRGSSRDIYYGIRNVFDTDETFHIEPRCVSSIEGSVVDVITFSTFSELDVQAGQIEVSKLIISVDSGAPLDSYACELEVTSTKESVIITETETSTTFTFGNMYYPYFTKKFFIKVI